MLASEFKDYFDSFMKETFSTAFSPLLSNPRIYAKYSKIVLKNVYEKVK